MIKRATCWLKHIIIYLLKHLVSSHKPEDMGVTLVNVFLFLFLFLLIVERCRVGIGLSAHIKHSERVIGETPNKTHNE